MTRNRRWAWLGFAFGSLGMDDGTVLPFAIYGALISIIPILGMFIAPPRLTVTLPRVRNSLTRRILLDDISVPVVSVNDEAISIQVPWAVNTPR